MQGKDHQVFKVDDTVRLQDTACTGNITDRIPVGIGRGRAVGEGKDH